MAFNPTPAAVLRHAEETSVYQLNKELPVYKAASVTWEWKIPRRPGRPRALGLFGALDPLTASQVENFR